ncbi:MAG: phosphoribosylglycinamide formyltransferase [Candidatus Obscuribacter sp.]|nr:phosphoribosylglycinamide formyltransferase [Candidatus Obscuribacter sp.]
MSLKIVMLASGRGSNVEAVARAAKNGLPLQIQAVLTNHKDAGVLDICQSEGLKSHYVPAVKGMTKEAHEDKLIECIAQYQPDFVVLAGYMRILTGHFLRAFKSADGYFRVINIHPSLLPSFPGATAYADAYAARVAVSGITVHLVDEQVDHGPILSQAAFNRHAHDSFEDFACRGLAIEHKILPSTLSLVARQGIKLDKLPFTMEDLTV